MKRILKLLFIGLLSHSLFAQTIQTTKSFSIIGDVKRESVFNIEDLKKLESRLREAQTKCEEALRDDAADPHHECCPVLEEIAHTAPNKEGYK